MTPSIDQTLHQFANLLPNWTLIPILTLLPNFGGFHRTLQRVRLANNGRLLLRTPGSVPFGTCICSNVETILSWTCHIYGPFEFRTSLGTSILLNAAWSVFLRLCTQIQDDERKMLQSVRTNCHWSRSVNAAVRKRFTTLPMRWFSVVLEYPLSIALAFFTFIITLGTRVKRHG